MNDLLTISDIELRTHIGVPEEERAQEQRLLVSIVMHIDTKKAGESDDLSKTINYEKVRFDVLDLAKKERKLIESFAEDIATMILNEHDAYNVTVTVKKFILPDTKEVSITIQRP